MKKIVTIFIFFVFCIYGTVYASNETKTISNAYSIFYSIKNDGSLWSFEYENNELSNLKKVFEDAIFVSKEFVIKSDNTLWHCEDETEPIKIMDDVKYVSVGAGHTLIVKNDNTLWGLGYNEHGQLGQGEIKRTDDYFKYEYCEPYFYEEPVKIMNNVEKAEAGSSHSVVLKTDGSVWTFGSNSYGELGCGNHVKYSNRPVKIMDNIVSVFAGESSSFAIDKNNTMYRWGSNYGNGVGLKDSEIVYTPIEYVENAKSINSHWGFNLVLKQDNSLWIVGDSKKESTGYTCYPTGIDFKDLPLKLLDNVNCMTEWSDSLNHNTLILSNSGEVFQFNLTEGEEKHTPKFELTKIIDDIKLQEEKTVLNTKEFTDISNKSEEEQKAINSLTKAGIIKGISETEFSPDKSMTRSEIAALLLRMTAEEESAGNGGFYDVSSDDWYCGVASKSAELGIVKGFEDNTFRGDDTISKLQFVSLVSRTLEKERDLEYRINDNLSVPDWAKEDISLAISAGIISENENLDGDITRSEAAVILYKLYDLI